MDRRKELVNTILKHKLTLIEDDVYSFLLPQKLTPLTSAIPDKSVYICSTSKSLCAGLRVAFFTFPANFRSQIISGIYNINLKSPSLNAEIIAELIFSGTAEKIVQAKMDLARSIFLRFFPSSLINTDNICYFQWLPLAEHMDGKLFEEAAKFHGVSTFCSDRFTVGHLSHKSIYALHFLHQPILRNWKISKLSSTKFPRSLNCIQKLLKVLNFSNHLLEDSNVENISENLSLKLLLFRNVSGIRLLAKKL